MNFPCSHEFYTAVTIQLLVRSKDWHRTDRTKCADWHKKKEYYACIFTTSITDLKLSGSVTAISARTFLLRVMLDVASLLIKLLYGTPYILLAALILCIHNVRNSRFLTYHHGNYYMVKYSNTTSNKPAYLSIAVCVLTSFLHSMQSNGWNRMWYTCDIIASFIRWK